MAPRGSNTRIEFPDGTSVTISPDLTPEQITAIIQSLKSTSSLTKTQDIPSQPLRPETPSGQELWSHGSKRDKLALFVRNHFSGHHWFSAVEVRDQQLEIVKRLVFGDSSAIATYLSRLHEMGYLERRDFPRPIKYQHTNKLHEDYPELQWDEMRELILQVEYD